MSRFVRYASLTGYAELAGPSAWNRSGCWRRGADIGDLADQDKWIPAAPVARLLERAAAESGGEDFAVRLSTGGGCRHWGR